MKSFSLLKLWHMLAQQPLDWCLCLLCWWKIFGFCVPALGKFGVFKARKNTQRCEFIAAFRLWLLKLQSSVNISEDTSETFTCSFFNNCFNCPHPNIIKYIDDFHHSKPVLAMKTPGQDQSFPKPQLIQTNSAHPLLRPIDLYLVGFWDFPACLAGSLNSLACIKQARRCESVITFIPSLTQTWLRRSHLINNHTS